MINEPRRNLPQIALLYPGFVQRGLGGGWRREEGEGRDGSCPPARRGKQSAPTTCLYFYISASSYLAC